MRNGPNHIADEPTDQGDDPFFPSLIEELRKVREILARDLPGVALIEYYFPCMNVVIPLRIFISPPLARIQQRYGGHLPLPDRPHAEPSLAFQSRRPYTVGLVGHSSEFPIRTVVISFRKLDGVVEGHVIGMEA